MIALTFALARAWVRIYTRGLSAALRDARRAEIACDLGSSAMSRPAPAAGRC